MKTNDQNNQENEDDNENTSHSRCQTQNKKIIKQSHTNDKHGTMPAFSPPPVHANQLRNHEIH